MQWQGGASVARPTKEPDTAAGGRAKAQPFIRLIVSKSKSNQRNQSEPIKELGVNSILVFLKVRILK